MTNENSPLWQLEQGLKSAEQAIVSYQADADRFMRLVADNIKRRDAYKEAIEKLKS